MSPGKTCFYIQVLIYTSAFQILKNKVTEKKEEEEEEE